MSSVIQLDRASCTQFPELKLLPRVDYKTRLPLYELLKDVTIEARINGLKYRFVIPDGYITDLASVPKLVTNIFAPNDEDTVLAALVHDWVYSTQGFTRVAPGFAAFKTLQSETPLAGITKDECDKMLYLVMRLNKATWVRSQIYYLAVENFGQDAWNDPN